MSRHVEPLNGGLVTSKDPALLKEGQLSDVKNAVYKPGSQSLHRATGRTSFGSVSATGFSVFGIRDAKFDNGDHYLIAHASAHYATAFVGDTGTFGHLTSGMGAGTALDRIHYRNRFFLMNGATADVTAAGSNRVMYLSATAVSSSPIARVHGLLPVGAAPSATTAGGGTFSQSATGYYEYWTTEVAKFPQDGGEFVLESAFNAETAPTTVFISATSVVPTIQRPNIINPLATHWRIYRSPKKDLAADKKFPIGFMIAEIGTATAQQADTSTVSTVSAFPATYNSGNPFGDFTNASNLGADDGNVATIAVGGVLSIKAQGAYGYNFGGISGAVRGITVELQGFSTVANTPVTVSIGRRSPTGHFTPVSGKDPLLGILPEGSVARKTGLIVSTNSASPTTLTLGGANDRWFASNTYALSDTDFSANVLMTVISVSNSTATVSFDYIKVTVHYAGTFDSTVVYPTVVYTFGDVSAQVSKNHPAPSASTGDMYEDSLVLNDVLAPALVRYSYPGDPEAFPPTYFIDFETAENDQVRLIKTVNNRLVVGLDGSLWRINYLPSERDASFDRGQAIEPITRSFGVVNPMCACVYSPDGDGERLAFISHKGIHSTNGFDLMTLADLDWRQVISTTSTSDQIALINDPENMELLFYYRNDSLSVDTYECLHFSYDPDHILEGGMLKASGKVTMRNGSSNHATLESAWSVPRISGDTSIYLGYGSAQGASANGAGSVYRENGTAIPSADPRIGYKTRRMYLAGFSHEWEFQEMYGYLSTYSSTPAIDYTALNVKTDDTAGEVTKSTKSKTLGGQKLHKVQFREMCEGLRISVQATASAFAQDFLVLDGEGFGVEDSGK